MESEIKGKSALFTGPELDYLVCALIRYQSELRAKTNIMEAHAGAEHLANHRARLKMGERLLEEFNERST
jgi:hypothetical protein